VKINTLINVCCKDALEMGRVLESSHQNLAHKEEEVCRQCDKICEKDVLPAKYKDILGIKM
jgi:galactokinase